MGQWLLRFAGGLRTGLEAGAIGFLRPEDLLEIAEASYGDRSDLADPTHFEQFRWEEALVEPLRSLSPGGRMLNVFCGNGREMAIFARAGFQVTGVDYHQERITRARAYALQAGFAARFIQADVEALELGEKFDAIYSSPWMYGTVPGRARRIGMLRRMASFAEPTGVVVVSYLTRAWTLGSALYFGIARTVSTVTFGNPDLQLGDRMLSSYFVHYFDSGEAEKEAEEAGLEVLHALDHGRGPGGSPLRFLVLRVSPR